MYGRPWAALLVTVGCLSFGLLPPTLAQVTSGSGGQIVHAAAEAPGDAAVGRLEYREGRYRLLGDDGATIAYVIPRPSVEIDQFVGQPVRVSGRMSVWSRDRKPRIWAEQIAPAGPEEPSRIQQVLYETASNEPLRSRLATQPGAQPIAQAPRPTSKPRELAPVSEQPLRPAQFEEPVVDGWLPGPVAVEPYAPLAVERCGPPGWIWGDVQYLLWWTDGMETPPLVTTSPEETAREDAGVLGEPGTQILYGGDDILTDARHGFRIRAGAWLDVDNRFGLQGEYLWLSEETASFSQSCSEDGLPILARPFFNINPRDPFTLDPDPPAREDAQLVCYPDVLSGSVTVNASTRLHSAGLLGRVNLACDTWWADPATPYSRVDLLAGYRYVHMRDRLGISEHLVSLDPQSPVTFDIFDQFNTRNEFHGADLGMVWQAGWQRWSVEALVKTAIGNVHQVVEIHGRTVISEEGTPDEAFAGGLLAQPSNIGRHSRDRFGVVPELGLTLRYEIVPRWYVTVGYTFLYWSSVVRAGDQIDRDVNPDQLAPPIEPLEEPLRPAFAFQETNFWAQGIDLGLEGRW